MRCSRSPSDRRRNATGWPALFRSSFLSRSIDSRSFANLYPPEGKQFYSPPLCKVGNSGKFQVRFRTHAAGCFYR